MAYSLNDPYRSIRILMRVDGIVLGFGFGLAMLLLSGSGMAMIGIAPLDTAWPGRLCGGLLIALGLMFLLAADEPEPGRSALVTMTFVNGLTAIVLLIAYLQRELASLTLLGQILLVLLFVLCLICALLPLRYLQIDTRWA